MELQRGHNTINSSRSNDTQLSFNNNINNSIIVKAQHIQKEREAFETLYEISRVLNTGLDRETLSILIELIEQGVNPEALAVVVKELRSEINQNKSKNTGGLFSSKK